MLWLMCAWSWCLRYSTINTSEFNDVWSLARQLHESRIHVFAEQCNSHCGTIRQDRTFLGETWEGGSSMTYGHGNVNVDMFTVYTLFAVKS